MANYALTFPAPSSIEPSPRCYSFSSPFALATAIKTSIATSTSIATYSGGALNGSIGAASMAPARSITVTTTAFASTYNIAAPIVVTGTSPNGSVITANLTLTLVGGGETVVGLATDGSGLIVAFKTVTSIAVPAQSTTSGTFTFGVRDFMVAFREVRTGTGGNLVLGFADGSTDTIPSSLDGEHHPVCGTMVYATTVADKITLYT